MKALIDTNIILDVLCKREPHLANSLAILKLCPAGITGIINHKQTADIFYVLKRQSVDVSEIKTIIHKLSDNLKIVDAAGADVKPALDSDIKDYEDALLAFTAKRQKAEYIITRNEHDFANSPVPALSPQDFLEEFFSV